MNSDAKRRPSLKPPTFDTISPTDRLSPIAFASGHAVWFASSRRKASRTTLELGERSDQYGAGGPCTYTGRSMTEAHHDMGVTNGEFEAFVDDVVAVLDNFKVGKAEQDELLNLLAPLRGEIVEVDSNQTGTPLPSEFTAAPAL
jgi:hypothetical protein